MLDYGAGWLFRGADGGLYYAQWNRQDYEPGCLCDLHTGWVVAEVGLEVWGTAFPEGEALDGGYVERNGSPAPGRAVLPPPDRR